MTNSYDEIKLLLKRSRMLTEQVGPRNLAKSIEDNITDTESQEGEETDSIKKDKSKTYRISGGLITLHGKDKKTLELTTEEKTSYQETMDEFVTDVSDLSDFGVLNVYENEGVVYNEPKLKIMGFEVVKSSTPLIIREKLKHTVHLILNGTESDIQDYVSEVKREFKDYSVDQISFPRGVNGIGKYSDSKNLYALGCPIHTKGSIIYNHLVKEKNLTNKYPLIGEGEAIKYCYLKKPNPIKDTVIAFPVELPKEFGLEKYIDYDMQYEKTFIEPLNGMLNAIGWSHEKRNSIDDFFA